MIYSHRCNVCQGSGLLTLSQSSLAVSPLNSQEQLFPEVYRGPRVRYNAYQSAEHKRWHTLRRNRTYNA